MEIKEIIVDGFEEVEMVKRINSLPLPCGFGSNGHIASVMTDNISDKEILYVAFEDGEIVGAATTSQTIGNNDDNFLEEIFSTKAGAGSALIKRIKTDSIDYEYKTLKIKEPMEDSLGFYEKMGFVYDDEAETFTLNLGE